MEQDFDTLKPTEISKEQAEEFARIEAMPRSERRRLGKQWGGVKIPGSNRPTTYEDTHRV